MKTLRLLFLILFTFQGLLLAQSESLFNGKDLTGWIIYGTEKWYVEDGLLVCESGPDKQYGYLGTEKTFTDFELTLEFKQGADGNSGVFFRSSIEGTKITGSDAESRSSIWLGRSMRTPIAARICLASASVTIT